MTGSPSGGLSQPSPPPDEFELIARARERLHAVGAATGPTLVVGSGDDAAVISGAAASVVTVDAVVDGVHFRRATASPRSIGEKALAAALSDVAAMGAEAAEAYVVLGLPGDLGAEECMELVDGLAAGASRWGCAIAGGDVTNAPTLFLSITAVGRLGSPHDAVCRDGAAAGQLIAVTGELGGAAAGLTLLERPELGGALDDADAVDLRRRHLTPTPRLAAGRALAAAGAAAMIDLSDGLAGDALRLGEASGTVLRIELERLPIGAGVEELARAADLDPVDLAISGGEDYELLVCFAAESEESIIAAAADAGSSLTLIGTVEQATEEPGVKLVELSGAVRAARGFEHPRS